MGAYEKQSQGNNALQRQRTFKTSNEIQQEIHRLKDIAGNLELDLKSYRDGQRYGTPVRTLGQDEVRKCRQDLANIYLRIKALKASLGNTNVANPPLGGAKLSSPQKDRERLAQLEFQLKHGMPGEWSDSLSKELRQIRSRLHISDHPGKATTIKLESSSAKQFLDPEFGRDESLGSMDSFSQQLNAAMRSAKTTQQKQAIAAAAHSVGKPTTWAQERRLFGLGLAETGSILPDSISSTIDRVYENPFVIWAINQGILAPPGVADLVRTYSRNNPDVLPRVSKNFAKAAPYSVPGLGEVLMASQVMQVAGTTMAKGPIRAAEELWQGVNPFEPNLDPEERVVRAITIFEGVKGGLKRAGKTKRAIDDRLIQKEIVKSGKSPEFASAVVSLARSEIDKMDRGSKTSHAQAAVVQVRRDKAKQVSEKIGNKLPKQGVSPAPQAAGKHQHWKKGKDRWTIEKEDIDDILAHTGPAFAIKTVDRMKHGKAAYRNPDSGAVVDLQGSTVGLQDEVYGNVAFNSKTRDEIKRLNKAAARANGTIVLVAADPENGIRSNGANIIRGEFDAGIMHWGRENEILEATDEILNELGLLPANQSKSVDDFWRYFDSLKVRDKNRVVDAIIKSDLGLVPNKEKMLGIANDPLFSALHKGDVAGILRVNYDREPFQIPHWGERQVYPWNMEGIHYGLPANTVNILDLLDKPFQEFYRSLPDRMRRINERHGRKVFDPDNISFPLAYNLWRIITERSGLAGEANSDQLYKLTGDKPGFRSQVDKETEREMALHGSGQPSQLQELSAESHGQGGLGPGRSVSWSKSDGARYFRGNAFVREGQSVARTWNSSRRGNVGGTGSDGRLGSRQALTAVRPKSQISDFASDMLAIGTDLLAQTHGKHLGDAIAYDVAWHPAAAAQSMAHLAYTDKPFQEALSDQGLPPEVFSYALYDAAKHPNSRHTVLGQMQEIFA